MTVYKYPIKPNDYFSLTLPVGAKILTVDSQRGQGGQPQLWALVDEKESRTETRRFRMAGTGHPIGDSPDRLEFVSTFQQEGGALIFHVFEIKP